MKKIKLPYILSTNQKAELPLVMICVQVVFTTGKIMETINKSGTKQVSTVLHVVQISMMIVGWLFLGLTGHLRQYFSLCRAVSQREGERQEK